MDCCTLIFRYGRFCKLSCGACARHGTQCLFCLLCLRSVRASLDSGARCRLLFGNLFPNSHRQPYTSSDHQCSTSKSPHCHRCRYWSFHCFRRSQGHRPYHCRSCDVYYTRSCDKTRNRSVPLQSCLHRGSNGTQCARGNSHRHYLDDNSFDGSRVFTSAAYPFGYYQHIASAYGSDLCTA